MAVGIEIAEVSEGFYQSLMSIRTLRRVKTPWCNAAFRSVSKTGNKKCWEGAGFSLPSKQVLSDLGELLQIHIAGVGDGD